MQGPPGQARGSETQRQMKCDPRLWNIDNIAETSMQTATVPGKAWSGKNKLGSTHRGHQPLNKVTPTGRNQHRLYRHRSI